jgi:hypothetical protein
MPRRSGWRKAFDHKATADHVAGHGESQAGVNGARISGRDAADISRILASRQNRPDDTLPFGIVAYCV